MLNVEHKLMQQIAPNQTYELLPHAHKLEVFEYALANTTGEDLAKILWLKSETSETWLQVSALVCVCVCVCGACGIVVSRFLWRLRRSHWAPATHGTRGGHALTCIVPRVTDEYRLPPPCSRSVELTTRGRWPS